VVRGGDLAFSGGKNNWRVQTIRQKARGKSKDKPEQAYALVEKHHARPRTAKLDDKKPQVRRRRRKKGRCGERVNGNGEKK